MPLSEAQLSWAAASALLTHALSTETEEVMGVLLGRWDGDDTALVRRIRVLRRLDRKQDRVEVSSEQLGAAAEEVEALNARSAPEDRVAVVGWYHSHPHMTVQPSHVDLRTQQQYQALDPRFVGVIVSCFDAHSPVSLGAFQTDPATGQRVDVRVRVRASTAEARLADADAAAQAAQLQRTLFAEEREAFAADVAQAAGALERMHHGAVYTQRLVGLLARGVAPLRLALRDRRAAAEREVAELEAAVAALEGGASVAAVQASQDGGLAMRAASGSSAVA